jgi:oligopeptide transport system substrate-binding protein
MYWDRSNIQLDSVQFIKASAKKALHMFQKGTLDWLGRPSRPWEPSFSSGIQQKIVKLSPSVTCWCVCNTQHPLLGSPKLRQALADALDRLEIIQQLSADLIPAQSPLPFIHSHFQGLPQNTTPGLAKALFQEALQNLRIELSQIPPLTLLHTDTEIRKQTAAAMTKQWKEVLGITIHSEICPLSEIFTKLTHGSYQLSLIMWRAWADDPLYTLDTFKCSTEEINFSKWQHPHYQQLINQAIEKSTAEERQIFLKAAEKTLIQEVPVIPIYHEIEMFSAVKDVEGITVSRLGDIDFKYASLKRRPYEHI